MSSFTSRSGTRGGKPQGGLIQRLVNAIVIRRVRAGQGKVGDLPTLVLHTVGRRSGEPRKTPVGWFPADGGGWVVVASAGGATQNPAWYLNLQASPDKVSIEIDGERVDVDPVQLHGEDRARAWRQVVASSPRFARYARKTDRVIPLIRLTRREPGGRSTA